MLRLILFIVLFTCAAASAADPRQLAFDFETRGDFLAASNTLSRALLTETNHTAAAQLRFEIDRLERIRKDFPFTEAALYAELERGVRDISPAEFQRWLREERFQSRLIDGQRRYMSSSLSNLFFRYPALEPRRTKPKDTTNLQAATVQTVRRIRHAASQSSSPYILPTRFEARMSVRTDPGVVPSNQVLRVWLPIPRDYPHQRDFRLTHTQGQLLHLAPADSPIRSLLLETLVTAPVAEAAVTYQYTAYAVRHPLSDSQASLPAQLPAELQPFTGETHHVQFTEPIRQLSQKLVGAQTNPLAIARTFYHWISTNIQYSYAVEYSTIRNISHECLAQRYGDCGQEALLFITLCRLNGIPARWQSGWSTFPGAKTIHDWSEIYLQPYGWIPVDPYMAIFAMQYTPSLPHSEKLEIRDFYLGGLDPWRMAANSDHSQPLHPPKKSLRSDTVDFQRGELEWSTNNIYFDQFSYDLDIREILSQP